MQARQKAHTDKYREIMNDWNSDISCRVTSQLVWNLENFRHLVFVAHSIYTQLLFTVLNNSAY
jgi:hypothetical protein